MNEWMKMTNELVNIYYTYIWYINDDINGLYVHV